MMNIIQQFIRLPKEDQKTAMQSYTELTYSIQRIQNDYPEIEIEGTKDKIKVPLNALRLLAEILKETGQGNPISVVPIATELTTQAAADMIGCSRPHLVKLLKSGLIKFTKVGKNRRIRYQDIVEYKRKMKGEQKKLLIEMIKADEESGLYDS